MNRFICALRNEAKGQSWKRGKQPSTVRNSHYCGEVHESQLVLEMRSPWFIAKGLLIFGLKKHSSGYFWLLFMASITEHLNFEMF